MTPLSDVYFFSDETGSHTGGRYFIVAGVVFENYRKWNRHALLHAESVSLKGKLKWSDTTNHAQRIKYLQVALNLDELRGRIFFGRYTDTNKGKYWTHTLDSLSEAMCTFAAGRCCAVHHQGLNAGSRDRMKKDLRSRGFDAHVHPADQSLRPEIRLADALCGYLGICCDPDHKMINAYPERPDWFVETNKSALPQPR